MYVGCVRHHHPGEAVLGGSEVPKSQGFTRLRKGMPSELNILFLQTIIDLTADHCGGFGMNPSCFSRHPADPVVICTGALRRIVDIKNRLNLRNLFGNFQKYQAVLCDIQID